MQPDSQPHSQDQPHLWGHLPTALPRVRFMSNVNTGLINIGLKSGQPTLHPELQGDLFHLVTTLGLFPIQPKGWASSEVQVAVTEQQPKRLAPPRRESGKSGADIDAPGPAL
ncbi:anamorsin [Platysternon megacephalum]|uniref:Anamorsin n=1 Tax=Platysternon megacephalum TaxID=55544 RepID=A0A4D9E3J9_9SAUR|nr:anamorsin [Platysternon megacephalum]